MMYDPSIFKDLGRSSIRHLSVPVHYCNECDEDEMGVAFASAALV